MGKMFRTTVALAVTIFASTLDAEAQSRRRVAPERAQAPGFSSPGPVYTQGSRTPRAYSAPPGYGGIITSTTPNEWGNLGGPSTGGGGGGGP
jgi:hypothetical protein